MQMYEEMKKVVKLIYLAHSDNIRKTENWRVFLSAINLSRVVWPVLASFFCNLYMEGACFPSLGELSASCLRSAPSMWSLALPKSPNISWSVFSMKCLASVTSSATSASFLSQLIPHLCHLCLYQGPVAAHLVSRTVEVPTSQSSHPPTFTANNIIFVSLLLSHLSWPVPSSDYPFL